MGKLGFAGYQYGSRSKQRFCVKVSMEVSGDITAEGVGRRDMEK